MAQPLWRLIPRALLWTIDELVSGTLFRIFRASVRFGLVTVYFQFWILAWIGVAIAAGAVAALAIIEVLGWDAIIGVLVGVVNGVAVLSGLRPLARRAFAVLVAGHWPYTRELVAGEKSPFDRPIEAGARHLVDVARAGEADEIVVVGHSAGGMTASLMVARALELDADLGCHGPHVVLLTLGAITPAAALHPTAKKLRHAINRLAVDPYVTWVDCQSRRDILNFWDLDPVEDIGVRVGGRRRNPVVWQVRFRGMVSPQFYRRLRWRFFRLHFHFIMAGDLRAPYDYVMLIGSPVPIEEWGERSSEVFASFAPDGTYQVVANQDLVALRPNAKDSEITNDLPPKIPKRKRRRWW
jgi:pimeloyl-ACP methyl ester carboxylesterase